MVNDKVFIIDDRDKRLGYAAQWLKEKGCKVLPYIDGACYDCPCGVFLMAPSAKMNAKLSGGCTVFSFNPYADPLSVFPSAKVRFLNYLDDEEFAVKNACFTAEGALALIIENTDKSMSELRVVIFGGGRVGKAVMQILLNNGIYCAVVSREESELAFAKSAGADAYFIDEADEYLDEFDVAVNSIPALILNGGRLEKFSKHCYVLDLASKPGGTDFDYAEYLGLKAVIAPGLPGKYTPRSAGEALAESVLKRILETDNSPCSQAKEKL